MKFIKNEDLRFAKELIIVISFFAFIVGGLFSGLRDNKHVIKSPVKTKPSVNLLRAIKIGPDDDSIYLYSDGHLVSVQKEKEVVVRYFLVSYITLPKKANSSPIWGEMFFSSNNFWQKNQFDSLVYAGLELKRNCYQDIVITNIYEFKSESDYDAFSLNYKKFNWPKKHLDCDQRASLKPIKIQADIVPIQTLKK